MQLVKTLSVLALATGAVVAIPAKVERRQWWGNSNRWWDRPSSDAEITVTGFDPQPTNWDVSDGSTSTSAYATTTSTVAAVTATATPTYGGNFYNKPSPQASTPTEAAPAPTVVPTTDSWSNSSPSTGASGGVGDYMSVVSQWRSAGGLPPLTQDSTLEANAQKTSTDSTNGLEHELNPGTMAQVLAPGTVSNFESVYVGGWLCEIPTLPGLNGICATAAQGWDHSDGETGHAQILTSTSYTKIGCAIASNTNVWACDLA